MRKRWGVRVIAILMLIVGVLLVLLGLAPAVVMAFRGAGGLEKYVAIPAVVGGCLAALPLLVAGLVLLTLGRISDNFAAVNQPVTVKRAAPAPAAVAVAATKAAPAEPKAEAAAVAVAATKAAPAEPKAEAAAVAATAVVVAAIAEPAREDAEAPALAPVAAGALVMAPAGEELAGSEAETPPADVTAGEAAVAAAVAAAAPEEAVAPETIAAPVAVPSPQEEISALQAQLAALQAQLNELDSAPTGLEDLPAPVEDEGPAPGATETVRLPGADDAARIATEMAALETGPVAEAAQEH